MNRTDTGLVGVSLFIFLVSPYIPTALYKLSFNNMIVPFILILLILSLVKISPIGSVTVLLAIMSLFIEYRYRVLATSIGAADSPDSPEYEKQLAPAPPIMPDEVHPSPRQPADNRITYKPTDSTNEFHAVGISVNSKHALPGVRLPEETNQYLIEHGLA